MNFKEVKSVNQVKKSFEKNFRYTLPNIIGNDILLYGKLPLCLFICIIFTGIIVVTISYNTRQLTTQREKLVLERDALDIEWRNLILEENLLSDHNRVERIAIEKLQMQHVDPSQENVLLQK